MAEMDMKTLEGVVEGLLCPLCYAKIKDSHGHIMACGCLIQAQNEAKLMELMDWAAEAIAPLVPTPNMSTQKARRQERKLRTVQAAVRQALNTLVSPTQERALDGIPQKAVRQDIWGRDCIETVTDRRDLHGAITEYGATHKIVKR